MGKVFRWESKSLERSLEERQVLRAIGGGDGYVWYQGSNP